MKKKFLIGLTLTLASLVLGVGFSGDAEARVRIDLTNPNSDPFPIALTAFDGETSEEKALGKKITGIIRNNLQNSALFTVLNKNSFVQTKESLRTSGPIFNEWKLIKSDALMVGKIQIIEKEDGKRKAKIEFRLYDVYSEKQVVARSYTADEKFWRHIGHRASDDIYTALTGEGGYFTTRIVHISEEKDTVKNENGGYDTLKRLCVMDQDGGNYQCLTDGRHLVLTPRFNPASQKIVYMSYANGRPRLYLLDLPTGKQEIVGDYEGLNSSPRFSPDGKSLAMTLTKGHEGNPEIYTMDIATKTLKRLTFNRGIDTSPSYSPDGKKIVFNSTRGGKPALYIMDVDGNKVKRLTFNRGRYYAPVWSPRGDLIAFVKEHSSKFSIGVIDTEGDEERQLTESFLDESPTWSPNGRVILFARQKGDDTRIFTIDLTGYNERKLPTPKSASDPAWSPLLK